MKYGMVSVPAAPVRKKPNHKKEMVNQLLFGEAVKIIKQRANHWLKIESLYDGYTGWVTHHHITIINENIADAQPYLFAADAINMIHINSSTMYIPQGSFLYKNADVLPLALQYTFTGKRINTNTNFDKREALITHALSWLNAPYMWGGKTLLGVDCSGFCQIMYRLIGIPLARDAWQQAQQGTLVKKLSEAQPGDLAFFNDKKEIVHVGILLNPHEIIHASGKVRIDKIDKKGIIHADSSKRTHALKAITRHL